MLQTCYHVSGDRVDRCLLRLRRGGSLFLGRGEGALRRLHHPGGAVFPGTWDEKAAFLGVTRELLSSHGRSESHHVKQLALAAVPEAFEASRHSPKGSSWTLKLRRSMDGRPGDALFIRNKGSKPLESTRSHK